MAVYFGISILLFTFITLPFGYGYKSCKELLTSTGRNSGNLTISSQQQFLAAYCHRYTNEILTRVWISSPAAGQQISIRKTKTTTATVFNITYSASLSNIIGVIDSSYRCEQRIKTDCWSSRITGYSWFTNRNYEKLSYWPGGPSVGAGCACGISNTCFKNDSKCNCDANDYVVRSDDGAVTKKSDLPLTSMVIGDVAGYWSDQYKKITLSHLDCFEDVDECVNQNLCHANASCSNVLGSYRCICKPGFQGDGKISCASTAICESARCHHNATCISTGGATNCECNKGFSGSGHECKDVRYSSCNVALEMNKNVSNNYTLLVGEETVEVHCSQQGAEVKTIIYHTDREIEYDIRNNKAAGGFIKQINYVHGAGIIARLIDKEEKCQQLFELKCYMSRIKDYTWLVNRNGKRLGYWAGGPANGTGCACGITGSCHISRWKCNCDSASQVLKADNGLISSKSDLPITSVNVGDTGYDSTYSKTAYKKLKIGNIECFSGKDYCASSPCHTNANCTNEVGSYSCKCLPGYTGDGIHSCANIENCKKLNCSDNAICKKSKPKESEYCECNEGFTGNGTVCEDLDECQSPRLNICQHSCNNTAGSFVCGCPFGFTLHNSTHCSDIDECVLGTHRCDANATCSNTAGLYQCSCFKGFVGDGFNCTENTYASCKDALVSNNDTKGIYYLRINSRIIEVDCEKRGLEVMTKISHADAGKSIYVYGYERAGVYKKVLSYGQDVTSIGMIIDMSDRCHQEVTLDCKGSMIDGYTWLTNRLNQKMSYWAGGPPGGTGCACGISGTCAKSGIKCNCDANDNVLRHDNGLVTRKSDLPLTSISTGDTGAASEYKTYSIGNIECTLDDECMKSKPCHVNASCNDTLGSYICTCIDGFTGDGTKECLNSSECSKLNCPTNSSCANPNGTHFCKCKEGYHGDGYFCPDLDECSSPTLNNCQHICNNTIGSYSCSCQKGYILQNNKDCKDIGECTMGTHKCHVDATCANTIGSFACSCNIGYVGDGYNCTGNYFDNCNSALAVNNNAKGKYYLKIDAYIVEVTCEVKDGEIKTAIAHADSGKEIRVSGYEKAGSYTKIISYNQDFGSIIKIVDRSYRCQQRIKTQCYHSLIRSFSFLKNRLYQTMTYWAGGPSDGTGCACGIANTCDKAGTKCNCDANDNKLRSDDGFVTKKSDLPITMIHTGDTGGRSEYKIYAIWDVECFTDIDECAISSPCHPNATCNNTIGSYRCVCKPGFTGDGRTECIDALECSKLNCPSNSSCSNPNGTHICKCKEGYDGDGYFCPDFDECKSPTLNKCDQICNNTVGSYVCSCYSGFVVDKTYKCDDINECMLGTHICHANATCLNKMGTYACSCKKGYVGDGITNCTGIFYEDCRRALTASAHKSGVYYLKTGSHIVEATCENKGNEIQTVISHKETGNVIHISGYESKGSFKIILSYREDFESIAKIVDRSYRCFQEVNLQCLHSLIDDYTWLTNRADQQMSYFPGGPVNGTGCACGMTNACAKSGTKCNCDANDNVLRSDVGLVTRKSDLPITGFYTGDTGSGGEYKKLSIGSVHCFTDVDECISNVTNNCQQICKNTLGGYQCACNIGYKLASKTNCTDIDECLHGLHNCASMQCLNTIGSYKCVCPNGYTAENNSCIDIDECNATSPCHSNATCSNTIGSYTCTCKAGYTGDGVSNCLDSDKCTNLGCAENATCSRQSNEYLCRCNAGFTGDGKKCQDINECQAYVLHQCPQNCTNTVGSYYCTCSKGYRLQDAKSCVDIDECKETSHGCDGILTCVNLPGSYKCDCRHGYTIDKARCKENRLFVHSDSWWFTTYSFYSPLIILPFEIPIGLEKFRGLRVCINGYISFGESYCAVNPQFKGKYNFIAPYLSLSDWRGGDGKISYAVHTDNQMDAISKLLFNQTTTFIRIHGNASNFKPSIIIAATWSKVKPYRYTDYIGTNMISTFQAIIASDGKQTHAIYIYQDNEMLWNDPMIRPVIGYHLSSGHFMLYRRLNTQNQPRAYKFDSVIGSAGKPGMWIWKLADGLENDAARCFYWYKKQPSTYFMNIIKFHTWSDCPCTVNQVLLDSRFQFSNSTSDATCYRGRTLWFFRSRPFNFFTTCCYSNALQSLINDIDPAKGPLTQKHISQKYSWYQLWRSFSVRTKSRLEAIQDSRTAFEQCCRKSSQCNLYMEKRPVPTCSRYRPPSRGWTGGDPHIKTLDGHLYTFNGIGDYILLAVQNSSEFLVHCRMSKAKITPNATVSRSMATVFSGFAFAAEQGPTLEVYLNVSNGNVTILVDKVYYNKEYFTQKRLFDGAEIQWKTGNGSQLSMIYESGVGGTINLFESQLNLQIASSDSFVNKTRGLLGVSNQDTADDLTRPDGRVILLNSTQKTIYYDFGKLWNVTGNNSLFTLPDVEFDASFVPKFFDNLEDLFGNNTALKEEAIRICGSTANFACLFDISLTGDKKSVIESKTTLETFDKEEQAIRTFPPNIYSPESIVVYYGQTHNFHVLVRNRTTSNITHSVLANGTDPCIHPTTGLVTWYVNSSDFKVKFVVKDDNNNVATISPKITMCYCLNKGSCNASKVNPMVQTTNTQVEYAECSCKIGCSGHFCQTVRNFCEENPCFEGVNCTNNYTIGQGVCEACPKNYAGDGRRCYDINECLSGSHNCPQNSSCTNTLGSFYCTCNTGFSGNGTFCKDIDECSTNQHNCHANSSCTNTPGLYTCKCKNGFTGNGTFCEDVNECATKGYNCHVNATCLNLAGGYACICKLGYTGNGTFCEDVDECSTKSHNCHSNARCLNINGGYECYCSRGFKGNGKQCNDIDECKDGTAKCHQYALCNNTVGSYSCSCKTGFSGNGSFCYGLQKCDNLRCGNGGKCKLIHGEAKCDCPVGLIGPECYLQEVALIGKVTLPSVSIKGSTVDTTKPQVKNDLSNMTSPLSISLKNLLQPELIRKMKNANQNVQRVEITSFSVGSLIVAFKIKFKSVLNATLADLENALTAAINGSLAGFPVSAVAIEDIDECKIGGYCDNNAICENKIGSFNCKCKPDYKGNGHVCKKDDERYIVLAIVIVVVCISILQLTVIAGAIYQQRKKNSSNHDDFNGIQLVSIRPTIPYSETKDESPPSLMRLNAGYEHGEHGGSN